MEQWHEIFKVVSQCIQENENIVEEKCEWIDNDIFVLGDSEKQVIKCGKLMQEREFPQC